MQNTFNISLTDLHFTSLNDCPICQSQEVSIVGHKRTINPDSLLEVTIKGCRPCGHWFTDPMPKPELLAALYGASSPYVLGSDAESYASSVAKSHTDGDQASDSNWVIHSLANFPLGNSLEIGPGNGKLLRKMRQLGWNAYGVDLGTYSTGFQIVNSADKLPIDIGFDVLIFQDVLEHCPAPQLEITQYAKHLRPGGILFIAVPWSDSNRAQLLRTEWEMVRPLGHLHYFSTKSIELLLNSCNFKTIHATPVSVFGNRSIEVPGFSKRVLLTEDSPDQIYVAARFAG